MTEDGYELIVARPAARAIAEILPEAVSAAVIDFITGSLIENPRRVGRELRNDPEPVVAHGVVHEIAARAGPHARGHHLVEELPAHLVLRATAGPVGDDADQLT